MPRNAELWARIRELVGDVGTPGTLRRQAADLSVEMGDQGVLMAIDQATNGAWMPPAVRYKYQHFFTHWGVLAIMRLCDRNEDSTSIPDLTSRLRTLHREGGMTRDSWIEAMGGIRDWRKAKEAEEREDLKRLTAEGGAPAWVEIGPGKESARLNDFWNRLTGRERGDDGGDEDMEDRVLDSAEQPLAHPSVKAIRTWRNKHVAHQDARRMRSGLAGYEVFPMKPLVRAYWAVMMATHRVLLLADGSGLHGLYPTPQFSIAMELSGERLDRCQRHTIEKRLMAHSERWERLLERSEEGWHREISALRSKRDTSGAFDALVRAIVGLGSAASSTGLPPPTTPESLGRALGQGVLQGRLPHGAKGARPVEATPLPVEQMRHEGQRSVVELGAILWHAMGGEREAPELSPWMAPPHTDPIVALALALSRRRLTEYAVPELIDRSCGFPGARVWLIEIERAKGDTPSGIAVWRSRGADGEWRARCACVWTHGRIGSTTHPLVIGAQWDIEGGNATAGACVLGPSWEHATRAATDASRNAVLARRQNAIGKQMMAGIVVPSVLAWLDRHGGNARPAGRFGVEDSKTQGERAAPHLPARIVVPVPGAARIPPPVWMTADTQRAVEAIVIGAAREGWRMGASCPVAEWRRGWAGYAEMGAIAWHAIPNPKAQVDADTWCAMERALREGGLASRCHYPALAATSALVRKMLVQTGRDHVARAPDARPLCALEVPARLWRVLAEAGPCPYPVPEPSLSERWWLVEVEAPADDEPNAIALWEADGAEVALAAFLCADESGGEPFLTVVTWRTTPDGERIGAGLAALRCPVHADDPASTESQSALQQVIDTLAASDTGAIARAKTAIALHLASDGQATPLATYRASAGGAAARGDELPAGRGPITALFALERAPEPEPADTHSTGDGDHRGGGGRLGARHHVRAHWKRQAFGPRLSRRRWIVVEGYARGPAPREDQIVMTRLAQGQPATADSTGGGR